MKKKDKIIKLVLIILVITIIIFAYKNIKNDKQESKWQISYETMLNKMNLEKEYLTDVNFINNTEYVDLEIKNLLVQTNQVIITYSLANRHNTQLILQGLNFNTNNHLFNSSSVIANVNEKNVKDQIAIFVFDENIPSDIVGKNIQFNLELGDYSKTENELDSSSITFDTTVKAVFEPKVIQPDQSAIKLGNLLVKVNSIKLNRLCAEINYTTSELIASDKLVLFTIFNQKGEEMPVFAGNIGEAEKTMYFVITTEDTNSISITPQLLKIQENTVEITGDTQLIELD